jgi:hypothetical protein
LWGLKAPQQSSTAQKHKTKKMEAPQYASFKSLVLESMTPEDMTTTLEGIYKDYRTCSDGMKRQNECV